MKAKPGRLSGLSLFVFGLENNTDCQTRRDGGSDAPGSGLQSAGENAEEAVFGDGFPDTLGQCVAKPGQGYTGTGSSEIHQGLV